MLNSPAKASQTGREPDHTAFNPLRVIIPVLLLLLAISFSMRWYAREVTLPRYCDNPEQTLETLKRILSEQNPAGNEARRPYIIAAKLLFLVPQTSAESTTDYLNRIQQHLRSQCPY